MDNPAFVDTESASERQPCRSNLPASQAGDENGHASGIPASVQSATSPSAEDADAIIPDTIIPGNSTLAATTAAPTPVQSISVQSSPVRLRRSLGPFSAAAVVMGTMIGSGIFISAGTVLTLSGGAVVPCLLIWVGCGLLCTLASLAYIELGSVVPRSGGEFTVLLHALGPLHGFLGPLPAFLFSWMTCLVARPANTAIHSLAVAEYCVRPWFGAECRPPPLAIPLAALSANSLAAFVNCYSVRLSTAMINLFTAAKLAVLGGMVVGGVYFLANGGTTRLAAGMSAGSVSIWNLPAAFYTCLWSYEGWNSLNFLTEELTEPARDLPRALGLGVPLVSACFVLVNAAYLTVLSPEQVMATPAVAVAFTERALGSVAGVLVPLCVAFSVYGTLSANVLAASRLTFTAARAGHLATPLSLLHIGRLTPAPAVIFNALLAAALMACSDFETLITFSSFTVWIFYGLVMVALLVMRRTRPHAPRPFRAPTLVPWLVLAVAVVLVLGPLVHEPQLVHLSVLVYLLVGVLFYWQCVYLRRSPAGSRQLTVLLQKLLLLARQQ